MLMEPTTASRTCGRNSDRIHQWTLIKVTFRKEKHRMSHSIRHLIKRSIAVIGKCITGQVIAGIVLLPGSAAVHSRLSSSLDTFCARKQSTGGNVNPGCDKRSIIGTSIER